MMKSTMDQIKKLAGIIRLTPPQLERVLGFPLSGAGEVELQAGKEVLIAFINRVQNGRPTHEDREILESETETTESESENYCKDCGETIYSDDGGFSYLDCECGSNRFGGPDFDIHPQTVGPVIQLLERLIELDKAAEKTKDSPCPL
jgi:hypothetical protein